MRIYKEATTALSRSKQRDFCDEQVSIADKRFDSDPDSSPHQKHIDADGASEIGKKPPPWWKFW